jgi:uncharacterized protein YbjT (DUF2867 family)
MILLTGATGRVGTAAAKALMQMGEPFKVLVRSPEKLAVSGPNMQVVTGDLADAAAVEEAVAGATRALIVMGNHPDQAMLERRFADQAVSAGVRHLVKVSSMEASPEATAVLPKNHFETEQHIQRLGVEWTFLRPNYYMQNMLMYAASISRGSSFALPLGSAKTAMVDARDVGEVAAAVLTGEGHAGQIYPLTGPALMDFYEAAGVMSQVLGREIAYTEQTPEAFHDVLAQFIQSTWQLDAVCELFAEIASGSLEQLTDTTAELLGRPAKSLAEFTAEFAPAFQAAD